MNKYLLKYVSIIPLYVLLQILVLDEILFFNYINPYLYIILIINLPLKTPKWFLLTYAFLLGLSIDLFGGNLGFHSTATVFIAFLKPMLLKITIPHNTVGDTDEISVNKIGSKSFVIFSLILIYLHNTILFTLEHLGISLAIVIKIILSSLVTLLLILITELFKNSRK